MSDFFDEVNDFILSMLGLNRKDSSKEGNPSGNKANKQKTYADPDMQDAWDELEDYLSGEETRTDNHSTNQNRKPTDYATYRKEKERESLRQDYANLEVPYGASFVQVKKAFKTMLIKYHPDKHTGDPRKAQLATEITQKLNASFQKIKAFEELYAKEKK